MKHKKRWSIEKDFREYCEKNDNLDKETFEKIKGFAGYLNTFFITQNFKIAELFPKKVNKNRLRLFGDLTNPKFTDNKTVFLYSIFQKAIREIENYNFGSLDWRIIEVKKKKDNQLLFELEIEVSNDAIWEFPVWLVIAPTTEAIK